MEATAVCVAVTVQDYHTELDNFKQKLSQNHRACQKILTSLERETASLCQQHLDQATKTKEDVKELEQKIESVRREISSVHDDKHRAGREIQCLEQELEELNLALSEKAKEKDGLKEKLTRSEQSLKEKEKHVEELEHNSQEYLTNAERSVQLFHQHLGLRVQVTKRGSCIFIFTQINRSQPGEEYYLEMKLDGEDYRLLRSLPELTNLQELEDRLNATNNLSAFIVHIRKVFQKLAGASEH